MLRNLSVAGAALSSALVVAELLLRAALPAPPHWRLPQESYVFDREIDHRLTPNQRSFTHSAAVATNALGWRDRDYAAFPEPGTVRVACIGDSQTFGNGVALEETWPKRLEQAMNAGDAGARWEVINAGIPGTDTWQHEIVLDRILRAYHPDLAIVAVYPNDVTPAFRPDPRRALHTNSLAHRIVYLAKDSLLVTVALQATAGVRNRWSPSRQFVQEQTILRGAADPDVERGWAQVERSLAAMKANAASAGTRLMILVIPRRDEVAGAEPARAFNDRLRRIAASHRIAIVDPLQALEREYRRSGARIFIAWDGHNAALANAVISQQLSSMLRESAVQARRTP